jgi:ferredoxin-NADP reductase
MIPPRQLTAKLEDKIVHNDKFVQLMFELSGESREMQFEAGQYVSIKVAENGLRRSYSICSTPAIAHGFELMIDLTPNGIGTNYLNNLTFGQEISLLGPMGQFVITGRETPVGATEEAIVMVATGSGITPFRSMLFDLLQVKRETRPITLHWGVRNEHNLIWLDELAELEDAFSNFKFHPVVSQPLPEWTLCRGRVTDCLGTHELPANAGYYLCGGKPMIESVVALLPPKGVAPEHIHHEKFF